MVKAILYLKQIEKIYIIWYDIFQNKITMLKYKDIMKK